MYKTSKFFLTISSHQLDLMKLSIFVYTLSNTLKGEISIKVFRKYIIGHTVSNVFKVPAFMFEALY
jgi:hypothetical protein